MKREAQVKLIILGKPIAKARPKFYRRGNFVGTYNPQETEEGRWLLDATQQLKANRFCRIDEGPVMLNLTFIMPITKIWPKYKIEQIRNREKLFWHTKKRDDLDNCIKFVLDCLNGIAYRDDSQVVAINAMKYYGLEARTEIEIKEINA